MFPLKNKTVAAVLLLLAAASPALAADMERFIPIQNNGRVKAFDSFSRQTVETITGKERWEKKPAVDVMLDALADRDAVKDKVWVQVPSAQLREALGLAADKRHFSYNEIMVALDKIEALMKNAKEKRAKELSVSHAEKEAESLYARLVAVKDLSTGDSVRIVPAEEDEEWGVPANFDRKELARLARPEGLIRLEVFYSETRPFHWAWVLYLAAFFLLSFAKKGSRARDAGILLVAVAMSFHTLGLVLRVLILQRPPVSNMYESMVYMNWAVMVFAVIFAGLSRQRVYLTAGCAISALVMIYGDLLPIDANLEVLVPVLRSNYWLTIHVMTIVSSYGAFGLATAMGHRHLILELKGKFSKAAQEESAQLIYRVIQLGVLLIGVGTVLGGVWANESWGRFWGWDPKETWALITFLAYLVVVHLKYAKKIDAHWMAMSSVIGFFFVLMTWYGVNFVLGRGLHSYGFGSGGMSWITYYVAAEILFLVLVTVRHAAGPNSVGHGGRR